MSSGLPEFLDLARIARQPVEWVGRIRIGNLRRLSAALSNTDSEAEFSLRAQSDGSGRVRVQGEAHADLGLTCQRCLKPMQQHVDADFDLVWVRNEAEAAAMDAENREPLLSADGRVRLAELVEDELLLALPIAARHEVEECAADSGNPGAQSPQPETPARENPFAALKQLKQRRLQKQKQS